MNYYDDISKEIKKYFSVLQFEYPEWLQKYINTKEMLHQKYISVTCGTIYSNLFESNFFFSSLDHSIAVALIIWHFTHDKKQTLAGLFHDIATPDPIADNDTPKLSADRLEYSLSNALFTYNLLNLEDIKEIYNDIEIQQNEENEPELGFKTKKIARKFVSITSKLSIIYREDRTRYSMQFIADVLKKLISENKLSIEDLYVLKESQIISIIENSKYKNVFAIWKNAKKVKVSKDMPKNVYFVNHGAKVRYINPLFNGERMSNACKIAKKMIDKNLSYDMNNYIYLDFKL